MFEDDFPFPKVGYVSFLEAFNPSGYPISFPPIFGEIQPTQSLSMAQDGDAHVAFPLFQQVFDQRISHGAVANLSGNKQRILLKPGSRVFRAIHFGPFGLRRFDTVDGSAIRNNHLGWC